VVLTATVDTLDNGEQKMSLKDLLERWPSIRDQVSRQLEALKIMDLIDQGWAEK
jgi:hypothetical protein